MDMPIHSFGSMALVLCGWLAMNGKVPTVSAASNPSGTVHQTSFDVMLLGSTARRLVFLAAHYFGSSVIRHIIM